MLTTARKAGDYRAVASTVKTLLVDLRFNGDVTDELDDRMKRRIGTVQDMLAVGQFAPAGDLDTYGSSPDQLDLAIELVRYVERKVPPYNDADSFDMRAWSNHALRVLSDVRDGTGWTELAGDHEFVNDELIPFLCTIASLPPDDPEW